MPGAFDMSKVRNLKLQIFLAAVFIFGLILFLYLVFLP